MIGIFGSVAASINKQRNPRNPCANNRTIIEPSMSLKDLKMTVSKRLIAQGKWDEAAQVKDRLIREARERGLSREEAHLEAYTLLEELYLEETATSAEQPSGKDEQGNDEGGEANPTEVAANTVKEPEASAREEAAVTGLSAIPEHWPELSANAPLGKEIQWVQANRLSVVRTVGETSVVDLSKALTPAPSWAALGWLETSIRAYAKYVDVAAKASATLEDERELARRERLEIDEIRSLLAEMLAE